MTKKIGDKGFAWNPILYCKYKKRLVDKLTEECSETLYEKELHPNKMNYHSTLNDYQKICSYCEV